MTNRKSYTGFPTSRQTGSTPLLTSSKWGSNT